MVNVWRNAWRKVSIRLILYLWNIYIMKIKKFTSITVFCSSFIHGLLRKHFYIVIKRLCRLSSSSPKNVWTFGVWWYGWSIIKHAAGWPGYREFRDLGKLILAAEFTPIYTYSIWSIAAFGIFSPANGKRNITNWPSDTRVRVKYFS